MNKNICKNRTWVDLCSILPNAKYKEKWPNFCLFAKLWKLANLGDVIYKQLIKMDDLYPDLSDRHPLYNDFMKIWFSYDTILKLGVDIRPYHIESFCMKKMKREMHEYLPLWQHYFEIF